VLLINPNSPFARIVIDNAQKASRVAKIPLSMMEAGKPDDLENAFSVIAPETGRGYDWVGCHAVR
jgi:hypothetical protein